MKDGILMGIVLGLFGGALLFKHSPVAKDIVNQSEKAIKEELNSFAKQVEKKTKLD